jgi:hypothetical protein
MLPRRRSAERGEGNLGCILWLLLLGVVVLVAWKAVPVKMRSVELYEHMDELAKFAAARAKSEDLKKSILKRAEQLDIPLERDDIEVDLGAERVRMKVEYTIPMEILGFTYDWHFKQEVDRQIFIV